MLKKYFQNLGKSAFRGSPEQNFLNKGPLENLEKYFRIWGSSAPEISGAELPPEGTS
jgi:hypothetical protein